MRRGDDEPKPGKWEFPGGTIESDETPEEALFENLMRNWVLTRTLLRKQVFGIIITHLSM